MKDGKEPKAVKPKVTPEQRAMTACAKEITRVLKKHGFAMKATPRITAEIELFRSQGG